MRSLFKYVQYVVLGALWAVCTVHAQQPFDLDPTFELTGVNETVVADIELWSNDSILLTGDFQYPGIGPQIGLAMCDMTGDWYSSGYTPNNLGKSKIERLGNQHYSRSSFLIRRLNNDGTNDNTWALGSMNIPYWSGLQGGAYHVYPDGRVLMGGFHTLSDTVRGFTGLHSLIWFTNTGYLDTTKTHRMAQYPVWAIEELDDGKFLVSTSGGTYEGYNAGSIVRIHPDGERDTTFQSPIFFERAQDFLELPSGKYLVAGGFKVQQNSPDTLGLIRLNSDGSLDSSFHIPYFQVTYQPWNLARTAAILDLRDGRIIVTGGFDYVDGEARGGICMLDTNGNLLNDAFVGAAVGGWQDGPLERRSVVGITEAPDGSFYIYGSYHGYNDGTTNYPNQRMVSRLYGLNVGVDEQSAVGGRQLRIYPNPGDGELNIILPNGESSGTFTLVDLSGRIFHTEEVSGASTQIHLPRINSGVYMVSLTNDVGTTWRGKWVKE